MQHQTPIGPQDWIRQTLDACERPLVAYAQRLTGNLDVARDIVQDTFLELCRAAPADIRDRVTPWLYTVCRRRCFDHRRKEKRMTPLTELRLADQTSRESEPSGGIEQADDLAAVGRVLGSLPENQQEAIRLKFQHGLSYRQIAEVTNQPVGTVGYLIHAGLQTVRQTLRA
ncbi:MAG: sigma-70 family RNA polymerase sigma factor [Phycisphaeraceae bacterium]|nr:sigma-70 family RNA polymerase sigma factor [Phycisphaeraceae bacterium]